jgi:hypothetical protein
MVNGGRALKKKKYNQFISILQLLHGKPMTDFEHMK